MLLHSNDGCETNKMRRINVLVFVFVPIFIEKRAGDGIKDPWIGNVCLCCHEILPRKKMSTLDKIVIFSEKNELDNESEAEWSRRLPETILIFSLTKKNRRSRDSEVISLQVTVCSVI